MCLPPKLVLPQECQHGEGGRKRAGGAGRRERDRERKREKERERERARERERERWGEMRFSEGRCRNAYGPDGQLLN